LEAKARKARCFGQRHQQQQVCYSFRA
jgi:hypothetical protein